MYTPLCAVIGYNNRQFNTGPGRSELKRMEQYINQAVEDQSSPPPSNQRESSSPPPSSSQPFGSLAMMRMPGRGSRRADPRLVPGVGDETIEASLLGDLAVLSISNDSHEVYMWLHLLHEYIGVPEQALHGVVSSRFGKTSLSIIIGLSFALSHFILQNPVESMKKWDNKYTMRRCSITLAFNFMLIGSVRAVVQCSRKMMSHVHVRSTVSLSGLLLCAVTLML